MFSVESFVGLIGSVGFMEDKGQGRLLGGEEGYQSKSKSLINCKSFTIPFFLPIKNIYFQKKNNEHYVTQKEYVWLNSNPPPTHPFLHACRLGSVPFGWLEPCWAGNVTHATIWFKDLIMVARSSIFRFKYTGYLEKKFRVAQWSWTRTFARQFPCFTRQF